MSYRKFSSKDLIHNVIVTEPQYIFTVHDQKVYLQKQQAEEITHRESFTSVSPGTLENKYIKHLNESQPGAISLHEMNIDRPSGSMIHSFVERSSNRLAFKAVTAQQFDAARNEIGDDGAVEIERFEDRYPLTASLTRIFVKSGPENEVEADADSTDLPTATHSNRKYIRSLRTSLETQTPLASVNEYDNIKESAANILCVPGIFYGSGIAKGSIELNYYLSNNLLAQAKDKYQDGRIIQTKLDGEDTEEQIGVVIYNQGLIILTSSTELSTSPSHEAGFFTPDPDTKPQWLDFGTGAKLISPGTLSPSAVTESTYTVSFKGTSKVPTLMMYMYSEHGEHNYTHNPTFLKEARMQNAEYTPDSLYQKKTTIKEINKSPYNDDSADFENTTYISKIGIYDEHKNLIAIASLATPVRKTEKRDFMFKVGLDF